MKNTKTKLAAWIICCTVCLIISAIGGGLTEEEQARREEEFNKIRATERHGSSPEERQHRAEQIAQLAATNELFRFMLTRTNMTDKTLWAVIEKPFTEDMPLSKAYTKPESAITSGMTIQSLCETDIWQEGKRHFSDAVRSECIRKTLAASELDRRADKTLWRWIVARKDTQSTALDAMLLTHVFTQGVGALSVMPNDAWESLLRGKNAILRYLALREIAVWSKPEQRSELLSTAARDDWQIIRTRAMQMGATLPQKEN